MQSNNCIALDDRIISPLPAGNSAGFAGWFLMWEVRAAVNPTVNPYIYSMCSPFFLPELEDVRLQKAGAHPQKSSL